MNQSANMNDRSLRGYAAVFDKLSGDLGGFREIIRRGAFTNTVRSTDVRALWNHDPNFVLGRTSSRTLRLEEDSIGLLAFIEPINAQWARDLVESIARGDVSQMSFGFRMVKDRWLRAGSDGLPIRELLEVELFDVSAVAFPAYLDTSVKVQAIGGQARQLPRPLDLRRKRLRLLELVA